MIIDAEPVVRHAFRHAKLLVNDRVAFVSIQADTANGRLWLGSGGDAATAWRSAWCWLEENGYPVQQALR